MTVRWHYDAIAHANGYIPAMVMKCARHEMTLTEWLIAQAEFALSVLHRC